MNAAYNILFREKSGEESPAQINAFTDTWKWSLEAERTYEEQIILNSEVPAAVKEMIAAFRQFIGRNDMMAYLVMMTPRLVDLRRVLKPKGNPSYEVMGVTRYWRYSQQRMQYLIDQGRIVQTKPRPKWIPHRPSYKFLRVSPWL